MSGTEPTVDMGGTVAPGTWSLRVGQPVAPPAMPVPVVSLRDLFAAAALAGLMANPRIASVPTGALSEDAWEAADEMMRRRAAGGTEGEE